MEGFLTIKECADLLGSTRQYIHAEIGRGTCPSISKGNMRFVPAKMFRLIYGERIEAEKRRGAELASGFRLEAETT